MKKYLKWAVVTLVTIALAYLVSVTVVDANLMGLATPDYSWSADKEYLGQAEMPVHLLNREIRVLIF